MRNRIKWFFGYRGLYQINWALKKWFGNLNMHDDELKRHLKGLRFYIRKEEI